MENRDSESTESVMLDSELENVMISKDKKWVEELTSLVGNYSNDERLSVNILADLVFHSPRQLTRKLKPLTGLSPAKFIKEVRLQKSKSLLKQGDYHSIADVAYDAGFENHATFSIAFKNRFGTSPSKYMKPEAGIKV